VTVRPESLRVAAIPTTGHYADGATPGPADGRSCDRQRPRRVTEGCREHRGIPSRFAGSLPDSRECVARGGPTPGRCHGYPLGAPEHHGSCVDRLSLLPVSGTRTIRSQTLLDPTEAWKASPPPPCVWSMCVTQVLLKGQIDAFVRDPPSDSPAAGRVRGGPLSLMAGRPLAHASYRVPPSASATVRRR
jgi:hypothetical protein